MRTLDLVLSIVKFYNAIPLLDVGSKRIMSDYSICAVSYCLQVQVWYLQICISTYEMESLSFKYSPSRAMPYQRQLPVQLSYDFDMYMYVHCYVHLSLNPTRYFRCQSLGSKTGKYERLPHEPGQKP